jgi:DNA polymerase-3 subunit delta'
VNGTELLPWHREQWRRINDRRAAGRMPHALLLSGPPGLGKHLFARALSQTLVCQARREDGTACGRCRQCELFMAGTHPDVRAVTTAEDGQQITIDQIRELGQALGLKSLQGGYKTTIIDPADQMNTAAANALLKSLEEPPPASLLILVAGRPARLPATIRSRCQRVVFHLPPREQASDWLAVQGVTGSDPVLFLRLAQGAPLTALAMARGEYGGDRHALFSDLTGIAAGGLNPIVVAAAWLKLDIKVSLYWLYTWLVDMIRLKAVSTPPTLINADFAADLAQMAQKMDITALYRRLDQLLEAWRHLETPVNKQLLLEDLLLAWSPSAQMPPRTGT